MERGYVNLWRCSLDSRVFGNEGLWKVWTWCLMKASHQNRWVPIITGKGKTEIEVQSGQFIFGRKTAAKELLMTESTIRNRIEKLKSIGNISLKPDTHYTIITICNWERYQSNEKPKGQPKDNQRTTKGQPKDTDKNVKNVDNVENKEMVVDDESSTTCPHQKIIDLYNNILPTLTAVKPSLWNGTRKKSLQSRWKEDKDRQSVEWWEKLFASISGMPFLLGENDRKWQADLGWILKSSNLVKILEGNYKSKEVSEWR